MVHRMLLLVVAVGYVAAFFLFALHTGRNRMQDRISFGSLEPPVPFTYSRLFLLSLLGLYFEMLMIRWLSSEIRIFAYYKNFVLIACFLGFGLGAALCRRRIHTIAMALPMTFFTILVAAPIPGMHDAVVKLTTLVGMTSQTQIWDISTPDHIAYRALGIAIVSVAPLFACIVFTFIPLGQMVGSMLEIAPRGSRAYTTNVVGGLVGIVLYTLTCFLSQPPAIWFFLGALLFGIVFFKHPRPLLVLGGTCLLVAAALAFWTSKSSSIFWSPYQKLSLTPIRQNDELVSYYLNTNDSWYQQIVNLSPDFLDRHKDLIGKENPKFNPYNAPYLFMASPQSVLVLGAGMGNDVAAALRNTKAEVTAVEIDSLILKLGERLHFERPYQSQRVKIVNDDARSYIQNSNDKFDLILFSLLDSHTTASSFSNIRIDNFVYTQEAIARARDLLTPAGLMIIKFQVNNPWIGERLSGLLQHVFHVQPIEVMFVSHYGTGGSFYIVGSPQAMGRIARDPSLAKLLRAVPQPHVELTTDDWPYFYQKERGLPTAVLGMGGFLICFCWLLVRRLLPSKQEQLGQPWAIHFFLLGAGFMLLEAHIISKMALLFGTTWVVNSIVVSGLLILIVFANLIFERWNSFPLAFPYIGIISAAVLAYLIPLRALLFHDLIVRIVVATFVLCLPVLFAGMVFIRSYSEVSFSGAALGWNLIGAVFGGMLETISQATGLRALLLIAVGLYLGSWFARKKVAAMNREEADRSAYAEELVLAGH